MLTKSAVALSALLLICPASAQFGSLAGPPKAQPTLSGLLTKAWAAVSEEQMSCLEVALKESGQPDAQTFISRQLSPSDPPMGQLLLKCRMDREQSAVADRTTQTFVRWLQSDLLGKPAFAAAFNQCATTLTSYQIRLLDRLRSRAAASLSKSDQEQLQVTINQLSANQQASARIGCIKLFVSSLKIAGTPSGYFMDELSLLNGRLVNPSFDLPRLASARLNDLTDQGAKQLLATLSFENVPANELRAEIEAAAVRPAGTDYLACFLTGEWVSWFSSNSFCHGLLLEQSLLRAINSVALAK